MSDSVDVFNTLVETSHITTMCTSSNVVLNCAFRLILSDFLVNFVRILATCIGYFLNQKVCLGSSHILLIKNIGLNCLILIRSPPPPNLPSL